MKKHLPPTTTTTTKAIQLYTAILALFYDLVTIHIAHCCAVYSWRSTETPPLLQSNCLHFNNNYFTFGGIGGKMPLSRCVVHSCLGDCTEDCELLPSITHIFRKRGCRVFLGISVVFLIALPKITTHFSRQGRLFAGEEKYRKKMDQEQPLVKFLKLFPMKELLNYVPGR